MKISDTVIIIILSLVLFIMNATYYKKQSYYNKKTEVMERHYLNRRCHFNRISNLDINKINRCYFIGNVFVLFCSSFVMWLCGLVNGMVLYFALHAAVNIILALYLSKHVDRFRM